MMRIKSVVVKADRIVAIVEVEGRFPRHTSPEMAERVTDLYPDLANHPCVNAQGPRFADVMSKTSTPHLLEHVALELQAEEYTRRFPEASNPPLLTGVTKWMDRGAGLAQVQLSYFDDLVALSSLKEAVSVVNAISGGLCMNDERG